jgi:hypothetical protein
VHRDRRRLVLDPQGAAVVSVRQRRGRRKLLESATISVTPIGATMPALHAVHRFEEGDGYKVVGGVAGRLVHFHVVASLVDDS